MQKRMKALCGVARVSDGAPFRCAHRPRGRGDRATQGESPNGIGFLARRFNAGAGVSTIPPPVGRGDNSPGRSPPRPAAADGTLGSDRKSANPPRRGGRACGRSTLCVGLAFVRPYGAGLEKSESSPRVPSRKPGLHPGLSSILPPGGKIVETSATGLKAYSSLSKDWRFHPYRCTTYETGSPMNDPASGAL